MKYLRSCLLLLASSTILAASGAPVDLPKSNTLLAPSAAVLEDIFSDMTFEMRDHYEIYTSKTLQEAQDNIESYLELVYSEELDEEKSKYVDVLAFKKHHYRTTFAIAVETGNHFFVLALMEKFDKDVREDALLKAEEKKYDYMVRLQRGDSDSALLETEERRYVYIARVLRGYADLEDVDSPRKLEAPAGEGQKSKIASPARLYLEKEFTSAVSTLDRQMFNVYSSHSLQAAKGKIEAYIEADFAREDPYEQRHYGLENYKQISYETLFEYAVETKNLIYFLAVLDKVDRKARQAALFKAQKKGNWEMVYVLLQFTDFKRTH